MVDNVSYKILGEGYAIWIGTNVATSNRHYCIVRDRKPATSFMRSCQNT
jgi:hypothetical protein